jgi:hypothetical protein
MDRTAKINQIIDKRKPLSQKITQVETNLRNLTDELYRLEEHRHQLLSKIDDSATQEKLQNLDFSQFQNDISKNLGALSKLRERFSRDTLNIGVVGRMRQGKSRLLQTLSGLTNDEIPSLPGEACTAVRSTVYHHDGETYARVIFHSQHSFLKEVIHPYFHHLRLGALPTTLDEFARPLQNLLTGATNREMIEHLRKYHQDLSKYRSLLRETPEVIQIKKTEIPQYITQNRSGYFHHLAVKEVKIYSCFRNPDVGKIALVDVPGLGDTKLGDEELMLQTIGQEVDIILFVRRPDGMGDQWQKDDTDLYDKANQVVKDLPQRAFLLINNISDNVQQSDLCLTFKDKIEKKSEPSALNKSMEFVHCEIADCSSYQESSQVLERVLDYLTNKITEMDEKYTEIYQVRLQELQGLIQVELQKALKCLGQERIDSSVSSRFLPMFNTAYKEMATSLDKLLKDLRNKREKEDISFKNKLEEVLSICRTDTGLPDLEQIENNNSVLGGYPNAYYDYLNKIRANLSQHFLSLDEGLKLSMKEVKAQVGDIFVKYLDPLTDARQEKLIEAIANLIPQELIYQQPSKIKFGFQMLAEFELSYRGLVQHRIRQNLDILTPNESTAFSLSDEPSAKEVLDILRLAHAKVVYNCENTLEDILSEPSQAAFAIVEEFSDRIFRADGVEDEWQTFLEQNKSLIWREFQQIEAHRKLQKEWLELLEKVSQCNQPQLIQFLNV